MGVWIVMALVLVVGTLAGVLGYLLHKEKALNKEYQRCGYTLDELKSLLSDLENEKNSLLQNVQNEKSELDDLMLNVCYARDELQQVEQRCDIQQTSLNNINALISEKTEFINKGVNELYNSKLNEMNLRFAKEQENAQQQLQDVMSKATQAITEWQTKAENARVQYLAAVAAMSSDEDETSNRIELSTTDEKEIEFLEKEVIPRFQRADTIRKLVWTEYYQKPLKDLLARVLPQGECPGIYKITNLKNRKCYIGRSTDVRRRLTDHVKSAIGLETIASQKIHDVMKEEGIWNFSFELLEQCEKSQLGEKEKYYIDYFNANQPQYGYNVVAGSAFKG